MSAGERKQRIPKNGVSQKDTIYILSKDKRKTKIDAIEPGDDRPDGAIYGLQINYRDAGFGNVRVLDREPVNGFLPMDPAHGELSGEISDVEVQFYSAGQAVWIYYTKF